MSKTVWITGASSGIGREFARRYAKLGCRLILTARRTDRLEALAAKLGTPCRILPADLAKEEDCQRLFKELEGETIDIFINNAGFGVCGSYLETDDAREEEMIRVNVEAMARLFRFAVRRMHAAGGGTILNVASSAGLLPGGPYMAGYYASKAYGQPDPGCCPGACRSCTARSTCVRSARGRWIPSSTTGQGWCLPSGASRRSSAYRKPCTA